MLRAFNSSSGSLGGRLFNGVEELIGRLATSSEIVLLMVKAGSSETINGVVPLTVELIYSWI